MKILNFLLFAPFLQLANAHPSTKASHPSLSKDKTVFLIINGQEAQLGELPHQLMMEVKQPDGFFFLCGAVLINKLQALTAAHCVEGRNAKKIKLYAGIHDRRNTSESQEIFVRRIVTPKEWNNNESYPRGDISILTFKTPVSFNKNVKPIKWNDDPNETFAGKKCIISGWGRAENWEIFYTLRKAKVNVITNAKCRNKGWRNEIYEGHVCILHKTSGMCNGDSGGPLTCYKDGKPILVGISSLGKKRCDIKFPSIYTRTSHFKKFISKNLIKY